MSYTKKHEKNEMPHTVFLVLMTIIFVVLSVLIIGAVIVPPVPTYGGGILSGGTSPYAP